MGRARLARALGGVAAACLLMGWAGLAGATPTFVQVKSCASSSSSGTIACTWTSNTTSAHLIVVSVAWYDNTSTATVADSQSNTYTAIGSPVTGPGGTARLQLFYSKNIAGGTTPTITATFSGTPGAQHIMFTEYSGVDTSAPLDQSGTNTLNGSGTISIPSSAVTTTTDGQLIVAVVAQEGGGNACLDYTGAGYVERDCRILPSQGAYPHEIEDKIQTTAGAIQPIFGQTNGLPTGTFMGAMATFKASGGGGGGPTTCSAANTAAFTACIGSVTYGDTIALTAGGTYDGQFVFPDKGAGSTPITVGPANLTGCPVDGTRVAPATHAASMPKIVGHGAPALLVSGHHWSLICLDVTNDVANFSPLLVQINGYSNILARSFIHNPEVTSSALHPTLASTPTIWATRGVYVNTPIVPSVVTIKDNWIGSFAGNFNNCGGSGQPPCASDTYGILVGQVNGLTILNNNVEAFFNNIFITGAAPDPAKTATMTNPSSGGATLSNVTGISTSSIMAVQVPDGSSDTNGTCAIDASNPHCWQAVRITGITGSIVTWAPYGAGGLTVTPVNGGLAQWDGTNPSNITASRNLLWKNPEWQTTHAGGAKDYIEVKSCDTCTYTGNTFSGACAAGIAFENAQNCSNGSCPWTTNRTQVVQSNLFLGDVHGVWTPLGCAQGANAMFTSCVPGQGITITNNLWMNLPKACGSNASTSGTFQTAAGSDVTWTHNTVRNANTLDIFFNSAGDSGGQANTTVKDNVFNYGPDGNNYNAVGGYAVAWPSSGIVEQKNVVTTSGTLTNDPAGAGQYPNSFRVSADSSVGYLDLTTCANQTAYHACALAASSTYHNAASDGTDVGVNFATLDAALGWAKVRRSVVIR